MTVFLRLGIHFDSEKGEGHARLQSPDRLGGTEGFNWPLPEKLRDRLAAWRKWQGSENINRVELGTELYQALIGPTLRMAIDQQIIQPRDGRVLVGIHHGDAAIAELPLELFHDGKTYLQAGNRIVYREIRDSEHPLDFRPVQRALLVLAEPRNGGYESWGKEQFTQELKEALKHSKAQWNFFTGSVKQLTDELDMQARSGTLYDLIIFVAHGEAGTAGEDGYLVLDDNGQIDRLRSSTLSAAVVQHRGAVVAMVSCYGACASRDNSFASVAWNLARDGGVSAVISMQRLVSVETGLNFCKKLAECLAKEDDLFSAYGRAIASSFLGGEEHGTICLMARTPSGLAKLDVETEVLRELFNLDTPEKSRLAVSLPSFRMGLPKEEYKELEDQLKAPVAGKYCYRSGTASFHDLQVAHQITGALGRFWDVDTALRQIVIHGSDNVQGVMDDPSYTHFIFVGTRSHTKIQKLFKHYSEDFKFEFDINEWRIIDNREGKIYSTPDPSQQSSDDPNQHLDYALIEKIVIDSERKCLFFIAGLWDTSTEAAAKYLIRERANLVQNFGAGGFQVVIAVRAGTTDVSGGARVWRRPRDKD